MKKNRKFTSFLLLVAFSLLFFVSSFAQEEKEGMIPSLRFKEADVRVVLQAIAQKAMKGGKPLNLIIAPEIEGFRFKSWDGTGSGCYIGSDEATTIMIQGPIIQEAIYEEIPTYTLSILSPYGEASGEGAYPEDSVVTFSVYPTIVDETNSTRQVFSEWISLNPLGYSGIENPAEISLKCDLTEVANWKTQYYVQFKLDEGGKSTSSSGWFDEGTIISLSAIAMDDYIYQS